MTCHGVLMRTQHTNIIDKTRPSGYDRGMLSRGPAGTTGRVGRGDVSVKGARVVQIINRAQKLRRGDEIE